MGFDPASFDNKKMSEYVEKSIEAMKDDLSEKDWGIVGGIRTMAEYCDSTRHTVEALSLNGEAEPKDLIRAMELHNKAIYTIPQIISGLEKLGGSIAARKALDIKNEKPKSGLAAVRELRSGNNSDQKAPAKSRGRQQKATG
ncbi:hypothetical protein KDI99_gp04 [Arthrobacter phage Greenhouse]|uniref:Terminase small subunit n=3 Tax=Korravirus TaxID=1982076 RepID=A0A1I9SE29_9CAUD|nr:hypothetical protein FDH59_gp04 [Arthrobacter phage Joann]YP_010049986.1 hypothetical protein KDI99_gp04 [Arthrobacter phage Greenhouse]YP_010050047.1 hypothetical protein KDJ00_gp04 [Arthrobacter phage Huntingdon]AOQ28216.1 hypothetical protein SEA_RCIGASTRUGA_4 [Arthrobacter phage RcigaStruga]ALY09407.1 hypothetical protein JOANN_4 [Arthrobacter phage Joann]AOZ65106.1 hypothetical protein SEA_GREENHOUSE_4 [Arthrobacter phage Greenhouse]ATW59211.1 hypothetical protein SEA_HUNTINGDON_4 [Ar